MFEFLALGDYAQQILAALVVLLFAGATILRIYLICPLHASIREYFADSSSDNEQVDIENKTSTELKTAKT